VAQRFFAASGLKRFFNTAIVSSADTFLTSGWLKLTEAADYNRMAPRMELFCTFRDWAGFLKSCSPCFGGTKYSGVSPLLAKVRTLKSAEEICNFSCQQLVLSGFGVKL
jgi:hypothetical protein